MMYVREGNNVNAIMSRTGVSGLADDSWRGVLKAYKMAGYARESVKHGNSGPNLDGLGAVDPGLTTGLTVIGVLAVIGVGLWAFGGSHGKRRRRR